MNPPVGPLKILHLLSSERWTGAAEPAASLALAQLQAGHSVEFACIAGSSFERRLRERQIPFREGFQFDRRLNISHLGRDVALLRRLVREQRYDIIHCHHPHDHWVAAMALRRPLRLQAARPAIVRTVHRDGPQRHDIAHRWLVGKASDMVIAISQAQRQTLVEQVGLPASKVVWVRGSVDLERFHPGYPPEHIRDIYHIPHEAAVAGMVARMRPHRGHHLFLDAVEEVATEVPTAMLVVAGRGELKQELVARIKAHRLRHHMRRVGYRKNDLPETYAALDVFVILATGSDGTCRAMLEAMACGRPVIGLRMGAIADTVLPGQTGWLVEPGDPKGLAAALIDALSHPDRARAMGEAARRHVERYHTRQEQCQAVDAVYSEALARRKLREQR